MPSDIGKKLDQLANFQAERDVLQMEKQELLDQLIPPEIRTRIAEIEAEFQTRQDAVNQNIANLEAEIKAEVLNNGSTVRGTFLRAVWNRGRVSWDRKGMDDYALYHPEVLRYRKQGEPFVSITQVQGKVSQMPDNEE